LGRPAAHRTRLSRHAVAAQRGDGDYATIDRWYERAAYDHFRSLHAYDDLYERCAALKLSDGLIGMWA
jgi:hypothetical protein